MSKLGHVRLAGQSGHEYRFKAYPLGSVFRKGLGAVYLVTRRRQVEPGGGFKHRKMGVDQTDDLRTFLANQVPALTARGANCICVHSEKERSARMVIRGDLAGRRRSAGGH